ncbi:RNA-binding protein [Paludibacter sp. 221]|uniref:RNA recognition motif domain-containing protein n=1 Tax=Paludibacter sp. 221 TaxID=2302939 RepID=UPI0013D0DE81|nr:RNA-binding protein [Paludibacter sp. 221]NDV45448.1 RNA-binding protein [Paludibacter sp. 221]
MNIYIGNLSYRIKESDLRELLEEYGGLSSVRLIVDKVSHRSKGYAFAEIDDETEAQRAINELNGKENDGRPMVVKEALPKK